jgi:cytochrome P450
MEAVPSTRRTECPYDPVNGVEITSFPPTSLNPFRDNPMFYSPLYGGFWVPTSYSTVYSILRDADTFGQSPNGSIPRIPYVRPRIPNSIDSPAHQFWRRILLPLFAPRWTAALEPMLRELARKNVAEIALRGKCEVLSDYAFALPVARFCAQLGLPPSEQATFLRIGNELIYGTVRVRNERGAEAAAEHRADYGYQIDTIMAELIRDRKAKPGDDIVTALLDVRRNGESLSDEDILNVVTFLFHAGTDSTATAIGFAMLYLAQSPFDRDLLDQQPNLWPSAVEELLRIGAVHHLGRVARSDVEIEGQLIRAGEMIMVPTGAANRDPAAFPAPDDVDLARSPNRHLTFGVGPHRCLGAAQARLEVTVALQEFHHVVRDYELDPSVPISYLTSGGKSRPDAVHLRFTPVT